MFVYPPTFVLGAVGLVAALVAERTRRDNDLLSFEEALALTRSFRDMRQRGGEVEMMLALTHRSAFTKDDQLRLLTLVGISVLDSYGAAGAGACGLYSGKSRRLYRVLKLSGADGRRRWPPVTTAAR